MTARKAAAMVLVTAWAGRAAVHAHRPERVASRLREGRPTRGPKSVPRPPAPAWLAARLAEADVRLDPEVVWWGWLASSLALAAAAVVVGGPGLALVATGAMVSAPVVAWQLLRHRQQARLEAALPGMVDAIAAALRSGASLRQAVGEAGVATPGPLGEDLCRVVDATERGASLVGSLERWAGQRPLAGVRLVVAALCLGAETGGAGARAVEGVAATLRQRLAARGEVRALATQGRVSAAVIAVMPLAFSALASVTDPRTSGFLLGTPVGLGCLAAGLALDALGALWMGRLTRVDL